MMLMRTILSVIERMSRFENECTLIKLVQEKKGAGPLEQTIIIGMSGRPNDESNRSSRLFCSSYMLLFLVFPAVTNPSDAVMLTPPIIHPKHA